MDRSGDREEDTDLMFARANGMTIEQYLKWLEEEDGEEEVG